MVGRTSLWVTCSTHLDLDQADVNGTIATFHDGFDFFFEVCGWLAYPRDPQVHMALFWVESLKGGELNNFLGDLSVDDVFRIAIVQQYFLDPLYFSIESGLGANH